MAETEDSGWCTIESDPGVFTGLIKELGGKGFQVEELYGLDESLIDQLMPVYGLIFLFKWDAAVEREAKKHAQNKSHQLETSLDGVYFARQTVQNACATQAILSVLMNLPQKEVGVDIGEPLSIFKEFSSELTPELRGDAIGSSEHIRKVHNSFTKPESILLQRDRKAPSSPGEDPFHFVSFVPINGSLYEFDGLKTSPQLHGTYPTGTSQWIPLAINAIQEKISKLQQNGDEIRFNLMALIKDRSIVIREEIDQHIRRICELEEAIQRDPQTSPDDPRRCEINQLVGLNMELESALEAERCKLESYDLENERRRHNYIPFFVTLVKAMAKTGQLKSLLNNSNIN